MAVPELFTEGETRAIRALDGLILDMSDGTTAYDANLMVVLTRDMAALRAEIEARREREAGDASTDQSGGGAVSA